VLLSEQQLVCQSNPAGSVQLGGVGKQRAYSLAWAISPERPHHTDTEVAMQLRVLSNRHNVQLQSNGSVQQQATAVWMLNLLPDPVAQTLLHNCFCTLFLSKSIVIFFLCLSVAAGRLYSLSFEPVALPASHGSSSPVLFSVLHVAHSRWMVCFASVFLRVTGTQQTSIY
jgi:hypothetical protein